MFAGDGSSQYTDDDELIKVVDSILNTDDLNGDGYISFHEFMTSQADAGDP